MRGGGRTLREKEDAVEGNGRKLRKHEDTAGEKQPGNRQGEAVARRKRGKKRVGAGWRTRRGDIGRRGEEAGWGSRPAGAGNAKLGEAGRRPRRIYRPKRRKRRLRGGGRTLREKEDAVEGQRTETAEA